MVAFTGTQLPPAVADLVASRPVAGVTLFRRHNVESPEQVRALTAALQAATHAGSRPLLVATDQEGGQLNALGPPTTQFGGAMALGAAGDADLAERVARATALELRALGVNVNYAPVCDLASNPANPSLGLRTFGDDPAAVAELVAATVRGLAAEGVAATLKHFPGAGDTAVDTHHELAVVEHPVELLRARELVPFRAGLAAGAQLVMAGHFALPGLTADRRLPASLAAPVLTTLLRDELGFDGLTITDALDMGAIAQGEAQVSAVATAVGAGEDLLLGTPDDELLTRMKRGLELAAQQGLLHGPVAAGTGRRLTTLRAWLAGFDQPPLDVVGAAAHARLAAELATRSITLVANDEQLLPLRLAPDQRVAVIASPPADLTPADTSATVPLTLADALRMHHRATIELDVPAVPGETDIAALRAAINDFDLVVIGTYAAHIQPAQSALANILLAAGRPTVTVALRTPWDLLVYPAARTHVCSYGILPPSMDALAAALFGRLPFRGRLPVVLGGLHPRGHGLEN